MEQKQQESDYQPQYTALVDYAQKKPAAVYIEHSLSDEKNDDLVDYQQGVSSFSMHFSAFSKGLDAQDVAKHIGLYHKSFTYNQYDKSQLGQSPSTNQPTKKEEFYFIRLRSLFCFKVDNNWYALVVRGNSSFEKFYSDDSRIQFDEYETPSYYANDSGLHFIGSDKLPAKMLAKNCLRHIGNALGNNKDLTLTHNYYDESDKKVKNVQKEWTKKLTAVFESTDKMQGFNQCAQKINQGDQYKYLPPKDMPYDSFSTTHTC